MDAKTLKTYFTIQIIISIIAIALLFLTDFGGYYYRTQYIETWGYVGFGTGIVSSVLVVIACVGFFLVIIESYRVVKYGVKNAKASALKAVYGALIPLILTIPSAIVIIVTNIENDWWLDTSFYSTLVACFVLIALNFTIIKGK